MPEEAIAAIQTWSDTMIALVKLTLLYLCRVEGETLLQSHILTLDQTGVTGYTQSAMASKVMQIIL